jgi:3D (Asp-Asp-Asp) domain-containing protein
MRRAISIFAFVFIVTSAFARDQSQLARVTVYWASGGRGSDHYTRQHKCATGLRLRDGHCAVDPRHIPYGSQVVLADGTKLAAVDTGSAVRSRRAARRAGRTANERNAIVVDRFFETKRQAMTWAQTHPMFMPVKVVPPNLRVTQIDQRVATTTVTATKAKVTTTTSSSNAPPVVPTNSVLIASNATAARSPLNRLGR